MSSKRIRYLGISLPKEAKDQYSKNYQKTIKETEDDTDRKIYQVLGLEKSILSKWLYYPRQSTDSVKFLSNYQCHFSQTWAKIFQICIETQKTLNSRSSFEKEEALDESGFLTSDYTTKLQSSKHYGAGTKTDLQISGRSLVASSP